MISVSSPFSLFPFLRSRISGCKSCLQMSSWAGEEEKEEEKKKEGDFLRTNVVVCREFYFLEELGGGEKQNPRPVPAVRTTKTE